jgi:hypothetical protein
MQFFKFLGNFFNRQSNVKSMNPTIGSDFDYILDDPSVPEKVKINIPNLPNPCPVFTLVGDKNDPQVMQVYSTLAFTLGFVQPNLMHALHRWSSINNLSVFPRAGVQFNAYYDRQALKFFYDKDKDGKTVYTCESPDIVAHELGHAILDGVRPDLWNVQCLETAAFHEAFGDTMAILSALQHEELIKDALVETGDDLSKSNLISRLAEQMGVAINRMTDGRAGLSDALRNAVNDFMYTIPESLPYNTSGDGKLGGECHSFSRVFTGAWYEAFVGMYNLDRKNGVTAHDALVSARDAMASIYFKCLTLAPLTNRFYAAIANAMVVSARSYFPKYEAVIKSAFVRRKILKPAIKMLSEKNIDDIEINDMDTVWQLNDTTIVRKKGVCSFKIPEAHGLVALNASMAGVEIEIASEHYMEFNKVGCMIQELSVDQDSAMDSAMFMVNKLVAENDVEFVDSIDYSKFHTKTHAVSGGKLHRLYFNEF